MLRTPALAASLVSLVLAVGACGSASKSKTSAQPTSTAPPSSVTSQKSTPSVGPAAPEVNAAGDIPDNQAFIAYAAPSGGFNVKVPEGWARTESAGVVTFTDKFNSIRIHAQPAPAAPTVASATQGEVPAIRSDAANYRPGTVTMVNRSAGPAVLITYQADSAPDPVTTKVLSLDVERYEFWRNGTEVVLTLSAPHGADNVDPWKTVTNSFAWQ